MTEEKLNIRLEDGTSFNMLFVKEGDFTMGDDNSEYEWDKPAHPVFVDGFYLAEHQVTQQLWQAIMKENPSNFKGENRPVETVSWDDVQQFLIKLSTETKRKFRLPTEAEWEYAARGGTYSQGYEFCGSDKLKQVGWYAENSNGETHDVGLKLANELGLYDMSGNVWEWCEDWFDEKYYEKCKAKGLVENPAGADGGDYRSLRGGGYFNGAVDCRPASRGRSAPDDRLNFIGFRLCLSPQSVG